MRKYLISLLVYLSLVMPCFAVPIEPGGQGPAGMTYTTAAIPAGSTVVTLVAAARYVTWVNLSATATIYINLAAGTATSANFGIPPGSGFSYTGSPITNFSIIGSAASGNYAVLSH